MLSRPIIALLFLLPGLLPAQQLGPTLPSTTLVYFRQEDPLGSFQKLLGSSLFWDKPVDVQSELFGPMDQALAQADGFLEFPVGSLSAFLKSIKAVEGALYSLVMTDGFPEVEFALVITSTMAEEIYNLVSGKLIQEQLAEQLGEGELSVSIGDMFGIAIGRDGDRLIVANNEIRMRQTLKALGTSVPDSLTQSKHFQAVASTSPKDEVFYSRIGPFLDMARDFGSRRSARMASPFSAMDALGMFKLYALGFVDDKQSSRIAVNATESIPLFDIFACKGATPQALGEMPTETVFGITYGGDLTVVWKKASSILLDTEKFPFATQVTRGLSDFQQEVGFKVEELAALGSRGFSFGVLPDRNGRIDDRMENFFLVGRHGDPAMVRALADKFMARMQTTEGMEFTTKDEQGMTWIVGKTKNGRDNPCIAIGQDQVFVSDESVVRRLVDIQGGKEPGLAAAGALKGLKPGASAYMFLGLKSIMAQEREFGPGYARMKDGAGVATTLEMSGERMAVATNQSIGQIIGAFATAASIYESQDSARTQVRTDLEKIAKAYREFKGQRERNPKSTEELGFVGETALKFPPNRAAGEAGSNYVIVDAPSPSENLSEGRIIIAHTPDATLGRTVAYLSGDVRTMGEADFRRALATQASGGR